MVAEEGVGREGPVETWNLTLTRSSGCMHRELTIPAVSPQTAWSIAYVGRNDLGFDGEPFRVESENAFSFGGVDADEDGARLDVEATEDMSLIPLLIQVAVVRFGGKQELEIQFRLRRDFDLSKNNLADLIYRRSRD